MARRLDHRRDQQQLGEHLQRLHQQEGQGETTSVDTPAEHVAARGRRQLGSLTCTCNQNQEAEQQVFNFQFHILLTH